MNVLERNIGGPWLESKFDGCNAEVASHTRLGVSFPLSTISQLSNDKSLGLVSVDGMNK